MTESVLVRPDFLSPAERLGLINQFAAGRAGGQHFSGNRTQVTATGIDDIRARCVQELRDHYQDPAIIPEHWSVIVEMREGDSQPLHADAQLHDGNDNHTPWRTHVALVYLTTEGVEHDGGALRLPELGLDFPPLAGQLIGFPATNDYMHEVAPVTRGARLALATWMQH